MLDFYFTSQFKKDLKLMEKHRKNMDKIYEIMALLIWGEPLPTPELTPIIFNGRGL
jgi:mRNA-degrading endonuclease YafQ of YafQ-DinJ toxin-antitoxin module